MKKYIIICVIGLLFLVGCSSNTPPKNAQNAIDAITERYKEDYDGDIKDNFSFLIYENKDTDDLLIEAYVPSNNEANKIEKKFQYTLSSNDLKSIFYTSDYNNLMTDKYTKIYTSGKFAE